MSIEIYAIVLITMVNSYALGRKVGTPNRLQVGRKFHGTRLFGRKGVRFARKLAIAGAHALGKAGGAAIGGAIGGPMGAAIGAGMGSAAAKMIR